MPKAKEVCWHVWGNKKQFCVSIVRKEKIIKNIFDFFVFSIKLLDYKTSDLIKAMFYSFMIFKKLKDANQ